MLSIIKSYPELATSYPPDGEAGIPWALRSKVMMEITIGECTHLASEPPIDSECLECDLWAPTPDLLADEAALQEFFRDMLETPPQVVVVSAEIADMFDPGSDDPDDAETWQRRYLRTVQAWHHDWKNN